MRNDDLTAALAAESAAMISLHSLCEHLPILWRLGDGNGGFIFEVLTNCARDRGLVHELQKITRPKSKVSRIKVLKVVEQHGMVCKYCGCDLTPATLTIDHVVPWSRGGTTDVSNLVPACRPCNTKKGRKRGIEIPA